MKPPVLNQVAIWLPMKRDGLDVKTYDSYQFVNNGKIGSATKTRPVVRYAKNYKDGDNKFSLCLVSLERDTEKMERFLDRKAKTIDVHSGKKFYLTEVYYEA
jgi:hypothetical protein